jgi:pyruvate dehydrogenase E2 component (dihydrolipoyllysine-residue acetyltransferase)
MAQIVNMPKLGFDMAEGTLVRWVVQEGETIAKGAVLAEIETDKATVEVESAYDGVVASHLVKTGDIVPVNTPIAVIAAPGEKYAAAQPGAEKAPAISSEIIPPASSVVEPAAAPQPEEEEGNLPGGVKASPLARRVAQERGIDLRQIPGSGPGGRVTKKDVESYVPQVEPAAPAPIRPASPLAPPPLPLGAAISQDEMVPLNRLRSIIGRRMVEAKQQVPHFYVTHEYDMAGVMALRQQVNALLPEDAKTSVNDYLVKAAALALREFPNLNASLSGEQILRHAEVNIGIAVAVEGGLLTVVCRDADRKPLRQISADVRLMAARAREGKVRPEDIEGSTFSVSNLGMFDVEHFIAIINPPEAAILALGSVRELPVVKDGQVVPGLRMKATLSVDHRVSDGAEAARFLQAVARYVDQPMLLLI